MPKNKTHSGTKKRIKITGSGKLQREGSKMRHILEKKSSKLQRRLKEDQIVSPADTKRIKKLLGL